MTAGIAAVAGLAASWRRTCSPLVPGRRLSSRMRAGRPAVGRRPGAVASGLGRVQLDVRAGALEQALDDQNVVLVIVDVKHDAVHGADVGAWDGAFACAGTVREARPT